MPTSHDSLLQEAHTIIKERDTTIFNQRVNISALLSEISSLKFSLECQKQLSTVQVVSEDRAEKIGRFVREIAGCKE